MALIVNNASGIAANTNTTTNIPVTIYNPLPFLQTGMQMWTAYFWATEWDTAQVQLFICPQIGNGSIQPVWFPLLDSSGNPILVGAPTPVTPPPTNNSSGSTSTGTTSGSTNTSGTTTSTTTPSTTSYNKYTNFSCRWGGIQAVVTNASANTSGLYCSLAYTPT